MIPVRMNRRGKESASIALLIVLTLRNCVTSGWISGFSYLREISQQNCTSNAAYDGALFFQNQESKRDKDQEVEFDGAKRNKKKGTPCPLAKLITNGIEIKAIHFSSRRCRKSQRNARSARRFRTWNAA